MTGRRVAPLAIDGGAGGAGERLAGRQVAVPDELAEAMRAAGATVSFEPAQRAEVGRDWWPLAIGWAAHGLVAARPSAVVRPGDAHQVAAVLAACARAAVPVTPVAGLSGVCGGAVSLYGGVALDTTGLVGDVSVDETSLVAEVPAGVFGPDLEAALRATGDGYTLGHWPQSMDLSTVGGWVACRGAGQYSTRYGKIEDMVVGLEVATPDGALVRTGGHAPRAAVGPDLTQVFCGSEGVLGVITRVWLRVHPLPGAQGRRAFGFASFGEGLDACRRILRRGATPAVIRLYDRAESARSLSVEDTCALIVLDEADPGLLAATLAVVDEECVGSTRLSAEVVGHWLEHRNDVSALGGLWQAGIVVDTAEVAGRWRVLPTVAADVVDALERLEGTLVASVHQSHAYLDGACLYFTFAGRRPDGAEPGRSGPSPASGRSDGPGAPRASGASAPSGPSDPPGGAGLAWQEGYYRCAWDTLTAVVESHGAAISHHHGIGLNRGRFIADALGPAYRVLASIKRALDPAGVMNPGKLGLANPFGEVPWP